MLWVLSTVLASAFQVARNGAQRRIMGDAGPWGATLVRFLFGLPFSGALAATAWMLSATADPRLSTVFWFEAALGAGAQLVATAALLVAMRRAGFAVGTSLQQSSLPLAALIGLVAFGDRLHPLAWFGVAVTTAGLLALTWPRQAAGPSPMSGAAFGLLSGLAFGLSLNAFGHAARRLDPDHPVLAALQTVVAVQAMQSVTLGSVLLLTAPGVVQGIVQNWRKSLVAGALGSAASAGWFIALALAPAASVRAVGVIEAPMAAFAGHRLFGERVHAWQLLAGATVAIGVALTSLG